MRKRRCQIHSARTNLTAGVNHQEERHNYTISKAKNTHFIQVRLLQIHAAQILLIVIHFRLVYTRCPPKKDEQQTQKTGNSVGCFLIDRFTYSHL